MSENEMTNAQDEQQDTAARVMECWREMCSWVAIDAKEHDDRGVREYAAGLQAKADALRPELERLLAERDAARAECERLREKAAASTKQALSGLGAAVEWEQAFKEHWPEISRNDPGAAIDQVAATLQTAEAEAARMREALEAVRDWLEGAAQAEGVIAAQIVLESLHNNCLLIIERALAPATGAHGTEASA